MAKRKRVEQRSRQANYQLEWKAAGICPGCGVERLDYNAHRGKPYALGPACRKRKNESQKLLMRERAKAGIS